MDYRAAREALRERRFRLRWSIGRLATAAGVDRSTIYRIENTLTLPDYQPEWATMVKLARILDTTLDTLTAEPAAATTPAAPAPSPLQAEAQEVARLWPTLSAELRQAIWLLIQPPTRAKQRGGGGSPGGVQGSDQASIHGRRRR